MNKLSNQFIGIYIYAIQHSLGPEHIATAHVLTQVAPGQFNIISCVFADNVDAIERQEQTYGTAEAQLLPLRQHDVYCVRADANVCHLSTCVGCLCAVAA